MVSDMESFRDADEALAEVERASAAPYVDYPPTPAWYPPAVGAWTAALTMATTLADRILFGAALAALLAIELAALALYRRYRGTLPSMRRVPAEIGRAMRQFFVGATAVLAAVVTVYALASPVVAAGVAFVTVTALLHWYEERYAAAAAAARDRLS
jgi:hypothetical protein